MEKERYDVLMQTILNCINGLHPSRCMTYDEALEYTRGKINELGQPPYNITIEVFLTEYVRAIDAYNITGGHRRFSPTYTFKKEGYTDEQIEEYRKHYNEQMREEVERHNLRVDRENMQMSGSVRKLARKIVEDLKRIDAAPQTPQNSIPDSVSSSYRNIVRVTTPQTEYKNTPLPQFKKIMETDEATKIYNALKGQRFLDTETPLNNFLYCFGLIDQYDTNEPLQWIKTNSLTKGINPNKRSVLDFLTLLGYTEIEIKAKVKDCFVFSNDSKIHNNNYEYEKGRWQTASEFHNELENIINKSKKK